VLRATNVNVEPRTTPCVFCHIRAQVRAVAIRGVAARGDPNREIISLHAPVEHG
jgi:hypothetical protein